MVLVVFEEEELESFGASKMQDRNNDKEGWLVPPTTAKLITLLTCLLKSIKWRVSAPPCGAFSLQQPEGAVNRPAVLVEGLSGVGSQRGWAGSKK
jgi:hypothetical protein